MQGTSLAEQGAHPRSKQSPAPWGSSHSSVGNLQGLAGGACTQPLPRYESLPELSSLACRPSAPLPADLQRHATPVRPGIRLHVCPAAGASSSTYLKYVASGGVR